MTTRRALGLAAAVALATALALAPRGHPQSTSEFEIVAVGAAPEPAGDAVEWHPAGTTEACVERVPSGFPPGAEYEAIVTIDGRVETSAGTDSGVIEGGSGFRYCVRDDDGLAAGRYEVLVRTTEPAKLYDAFIVGGDRSVVDLTIANTTSHDVCFLRFVPAGAGAFGPNDLATPLPTRHSVAFELASGDYAYQAVGCDGTLLREERSIAVERSARISLAR